MKNDQSAPMDWLKEHSQLLPSFWDVERRKLDDLEQRTNWPLMLRPVVRGTRQGLVSGAPMQRLGLSFIEGNFLQLRDRKEDPSGDGRGHWRSGLHHGVSKELVSGSSVEQVQKDKDKLFLAISFVAGLVPASLPKETIPCRHKGHAIEPGGPWETVDVLFVEHR